jgi:hypothetical protein
MKNSNDPNRDEDEEIPEEVLAEMDDEMTDLSKLSREELRTHLQSRLDRLCRQRRELSDDLVKIDPTAEAYKALMEMLDEASRKFRDTEAQLARLQPRQTGITAITIENFKGFSAPVTIPLRPITLLFGANSAGKSTIIQALHYTREILDRNNPDADLSLAGGEAFDLGGFRNMVHKHDLNSAVKIRIEMVPEPAYGIPRLWDPIVESKAERAEIWDSDVSRLVNSAGIEFVVKWSHEQQSPWIAELNISYNGTDFASIKKEFPQAVPYIHSLTADHPFLEPLLIDGEHDTAYYEFGDFLEKLADDSARVKLDQALVVPTLTDKLPLNIPSPTHDLHEGYYFWGCVELVNQLIHGPVLLAHRALAGFRYLGPIRAVPKRDHCCPKVLDESRWSDGSAAWDLLLKHYDPGLGRGDGFVQGVSRWMSESDRLDLGYSLDVVTERQIPASGMLMANLQLLREKFDEKDQEFYRRSVWPEIENAQVKSSLEFKDLKNDVSVAPTALGVGVIQVVPVVVASLDPGRALLAIEQPELHLHPKVACNLGDLFIDQIAAGKVFLIESHSEHLVLRLKRRIKEKKLRAEDISVLFVEAPRGGGRTIIIPLRLDSDGEFMNEWPGGFFEEGFDEIFAKTR